MLFVEFSWLFTYICWCVVILDVLLFRLLLSFAFLVGLCAEFVVVLFALWVVFVYYL